MKIGMQIILPRARSMATYASISQGEFTRDLGTSVFLASVAHPFQLLKGFTCAVRYTHMYLACILTWGGVCS